MTYEINLPILAADFNAFANQLDLVYGVGFGDSGYGQDTFSLATIAVDDKIQSAEWSALINAAEVCSEHQTSVIDPNMPLIGLVAVDKIIEAHESSPPTNDPSDINSSLDTLTTNRLTADVNSVSLFPNVLNDSRGTSWSVALQHNFTMVFDSIPPGIGSSADNARYFFNSGGEIRIRGSRTGGAGTPQNADWTSLLSSLGAGVVFGANATTAPVGTPAAIGYFQLTTIFQQIFTVTGSGAYAANDVTIFARTQVAPVGPNGDNGRFLEFRVEYNDDHTNIFFDTIDGTITSDIDVLLATAFLDPPGIESPTPTTTISLTAGS